jgi:hypothetical protein
MGESCLDKMKDYFALRGHIYLIVFTVLEILYFVAYTLVYVYNTKSTSDLEISQMNIFKWGFVLILLVAITYFLWHSVSTLHSL